MKAIVTGGAGFIGSNLCEELVRQGHQVFVIDNFSTGKKENLKGIEISELAEMDIRDREGILKYFERVEPDWVFHTAALARIQPSIENPGDFHDVNVTGTLNLLDAARRVGSVKRFVFSSSSSIYGEQKQSELPAHEIRSDERPDSPYAYQKMICEAYMRLFRDMYGLETVSLRYFNVYGERQILEGAYAAVVGIFLDQFAAGKPFTIVGDGEQRRDFTYVGDIVRGNILAAEKRLGLYRVLNLGTGENNSVNDIANFVSETHEKENLEPRKGECRATLADNQCARNVLGWEPSVKIEDWIRATLESKGSA